MKPLSRLLICLVCLFWGCIASKVYYLSIVRNLRLIWLAFQPLVMGYPLESVLVVMLAICSILPVFSQPKISKSVVGFIPINMINRFFRFLSSHIKPSQPVGSAMPSVYFKVNIPLVVKTPRLLPYPNLWPRLRPAENPGFRVIVKYIKKIFMVDVLHGACHTIFYRDRKGLLHD